MAESGEQDGKSFSASSFSSLGLHSQLCQQLQERLGFKGPTLVQTQSIPVILSGRHVLVNAATGTGKTVAYLASVVHQLSLQQPRIERSDGTLALVLVPTREQCLQVHEILQKILPRFYKIVSGCVMGGENPKKEKARLRRGISILVATPGRLLYHLKNTASFLHCNLRWIIFDEADRILELGFRKEIQEILNLLGLMKDGVCSEFKSELNVKRQFLLLSATLNENVSHLAQISLDEPVFIGMPDMKMQSIASLEYLGGFGSKNDEQQYVVKPVTPPSEDYKLPAQLNQRYVKVPCNARLAVLLSILKHLFEADTSEKIVLFFSTCNAVDFHYSLLSEFQSGPGSEFKQNFLRCKTFRLHGNMKQAARRTAIQTFNKEKSALLLSTDVTAGGLDIPRVRCIIHYDPPGEATEYVHRVGRTARLGESGDSFLFLRPIEIDYLKELEKHGVFLAEYPLMEVLDGFPPYGQLHVRKSVSIDAHPWVLALHKALESFTDQPYPKTLAKKAFRSWVSAYTAHRGELKGILVAMKLHLGHVAKSFALKEQPSMVGKSFHKKEQKRKRKRNEKHGGGLKKRKVQP